MKNKKRIIAKIFDGLLLLVVPSAVAMYSFFEPSDGSGGYIDVGGSIMAFGIIFSIFLVFLIKKKKLDPYFKDVRHILNNHRADYAVCTDATKKAKLASEIKKRERKVLIYERASIISVLTGMYLIVSYISTNIKDLQTVIGVAIASITAGSLLGITFGTSVDTVKIPGEGESDE